MQHSEYSGTPLRSNVQYDACECARFRVSCIVLTSDAKWRRVDDFYSSVWEILDNSTNSVREKTGQFLR